MTAGEQASRPTVVTRCPVCGRQQVSAGRCMACGDVAASPRVIATAPLANVRRAEDSPATLLVPQAQPLPAMWRPGGAQLPARRPDPSDFSGGEVRGRVLIVQQGQSEPMDADPWRWIAIPVWGLVLLITPFVAGIIVWMSAGLLPALGVIALLLIVLRFFFSERLFYGWQFVAALRGRYVVEPMPVLTIRLRRSEVEEVQLRVKGHMAGGSLMEGDRITARGRWRSGVFHVRSVSCERTGAFMVPRQPNALSLALGGFAILAVAALWLHVWGVPWAMNQTHSIRESVEQRVRHVPTFDQEDIRQ